MNDPGRRRHPLMGSRLTPSWYIEQLLRVTARIHDEIQPCRHGLSQDFSDFWYSRLFDFVAGGGRIR
jgi:hypothetical protein